MNTSPSSVLKALLTSPALVALLAECKRIVEDGALSREIEYTARHMTMVAIMAETGVSESEARALLAGYLHDPVARAVE